MRLARTFVVGALALLSAAPAQATVAVTQVAGTRAAAAADVPDGTAVLGAPMAAWSVAGLTRTHFVFSDQCSVVHDVAHGDATRIAGLPTCGDSPALTGPAFGDSANPLTAQLSANVTLGPVSGRDGYVLGDIGYHRVRLLDDAGVHTLAGSGTTFADGGFADGPIATARLNQPGAAAQLSDGSIVVADSANGRIRLVANGVVTTIAGGGATAAADGVRAVDAQFGMISGLAVLPGDAVVFADSNGGSVWAITATGTLRRAATAALPFAIAAAGPSLLVGDLASGAIVSVSPAGVTTVLATTIPMPISISAIQCGKFVFVVSFRTGGIYRIDNPAARCK